MNKTQFERELFELMMEYLGENPHLQFHFYKFKNISCNNLSKKIINEYFTYTK